MCVGERPSATSTIATSAAPPTTIPYSGANALRLRGRPRSIHARASGAVSTAGDERDRLRARDEREHAQPEHRELPRERRLLEHQREREREPEEERIERVLGHQRPDVRERRDRDGERGSGERGGRADDAAREQIRRERPPTTSASALSTRAHS